MNTPSPHRLPGADILENSGRGAVRQHRAPRLLPRETEACPVTQEALTEPSPAMAGARSETATRRLAVLRALVVEVLLLGVMFAVYELGRHLAEAEVGEATAHARHVWNLERWLHLPSE